MAHSLTQKEADYLFVLDKVPDTDKTFEFPFSGDKIIVPFISSDKRERFLFDISRASLKITKATYQNRVHKSIVLRRLDVDGAPHRNPEAEVVPLDFLKPYNGKDIPCPHIHVYIEGFGEKWAIPASDVLDVTGMDLYEVMVAFFRYCNVSTIPDIKNQLLL